MIKRLAVLPVIKICSPEIEIFQKFHQHIFKAVTRCTLIPVNEKLAKRKLEAPISHRIHYCLRSKNVVQSSKWKRPPAVTICLFIPMSNRSWLKLIKADVYFRINFLNEPGPCIRELLRWKELQMVVYDGDFRWNFIW